MSLTISGIAAGDTPEQGRIKINANDSVIESTLSGHMVDTDAHTVDGGGSIVSTAAAQTLTNKVISSASNTLTLHTVDIHGPLLSIKTLEYDDTAFSETTQDFGDQNDGSGLDIITISGINGIEVRKINQGGLSYGLMVSHPKDVIMDHTSGQTLAVNATGVVGSEVFKVGGKSTFTDQVAVGGDVLPLVDDTNDLGSAGKNWGNLYLSKNIYLDDSSLTYFGATGTGLSIKHDSSHAVFNTKIGNHLFQGNGSTQLTINQTGGRLQYNAADKLVWTNTGIDITGILTVSGDTELAGDLLPAADNAKDLGSAGKNWKNLFLSDHIYLDNASLAYFGATATGLSIRHNTSHAYYKNMTGGHVFENIDADNQLVVSQHGGALQWDNVTTLLWGDATTTITGTLSVSGALTATGGVVGNASTADAWSSTMSITLAGDTTGSVTFDGSVNQTLTITVKDDSHAHTQANVDGLPAALSAKMPKSGGTFTGDVTISDPTYATPISGGPFNNSTKTKQNRINFSKALSSEGQNGGGETNSNDPGYIIHETSNASGDTNDGVLHLCPTDDNSGSDYVAIHGTNDPTTIKIYTSGKITTPKSITAAGLISTGTIKADGGNIDLDDHDLVNVHGFQFKDWDDNSGGSNSTYRMLGRDGTFQIHNGGLRVGSFSNGTTFATGTSEIGAKGNIKTQKVMYAKTNYPVPITVAVGTDNNSRHISISNQGYWQVTGITLPQTGMYALRASIHMNITGQNYHKGYIVATLGNSTVGHYYASNYDDYHVYTSSHIGTLSGCLYKTAGSNVTLKFKFAYTPDGVTYADVRSYHLMYIGPTSQVVDWHL